jgi:type I restriction enzyme, S subunit
MKLTVDSNIANNQFIYYCFANEETIEKIKRESEHTGVPKINLAYLKKFEIDLPPLSIQTKIAEILSSLDDKIALNRDMNASLEAMAQTLFKEWFIKPTTEGVLPEGWREGKLSEVLEIKYGKDYKHLESGTIPLFGSGGIMKYVNKAIYEEDSILIPRKGTLSNLFYTSKPFWSVDTMFYSKFKDKFSGKYLFYLLKSDVRHKLKVKKTP